jgi:hypothetical protein
MALWACHPYIGHFSQLPHSVIGAQSFHFSIHSQPRDPNLTIYTFTFPGLSSALFPGEECFSCHVQVCMLTFSFNQILVIYSLSSDIIHTGYFVFDVQALVQQDLQPLQVYVRHRHVIIPSVSQLHTLTTPYDIYL